MLLRDNDLLIPTEERPGKSTIYALDLDRLAAVEDEPVAAKGRWRGDGREERDLDPERPKLSMVPEVEPESDPEICTSADEVYKLATGGARP